MAKKNNAVMILVGLGVILLVYFAMQNKVSSPAPITGQGGIDLAPTNDWTPIVQIPCTSDAVCLQYKDMQGSNLGNSEVKCYSVSNVVTLKDTPSIAGKSYCHYK